MKELALRFRVLQSLGDLKALQPPWDQLSLQAAEPNIFYESWMFLSAIEAFCPKSLKVIIAENENGEWMGLFPFESLRIYKFLPWRHLKLWQYKHCYLTTPLVQRYCHEQVIKGFFEWISSQKDLPKTLFWNGMSGSGVVFQEILKHGKKLGSPYNIDQFERTILKRPIDSETYVGSQFAGNHRRDLRRIEKRLNESGTLQYPSIRKTESKEVVEAWISNFLRIEMSGWKGKKGTALACNPADQAFFRTCVLSAFERDQLGTLEAKVGDQVIASRCNFHSGKHAFSFKIAFDEKFSKSRPGLLLEVQHIHEISRSEIETVDYCADPNHPMIDRLSKDRMIIVNFANVFRFFPDWIFMVLLKLTKAVKSWCRL